MNNCVSTCRTLSARRGRETRLGACSASSLQSTLPSQQQTALDRDEISLQVAHEILQHIPVPVIGVDSNEMITFANSAALGVFVEFAPMLGADARDVLPPALLLDGDGSDAAPVAFERAGSKFSVIRRSMGVHSLSQGRVYLLMPTGTG